MDLLFIGFDFLALIAIASHPSANFFLNLFVILGRGISPQFVDKSNCVSVSVLMGKLIAIIGQVQKLTKSGPSIFDTMKLS